jgi:hypothetical protein
MAKTDRNTDINLPEIEAFKDNAANKLINANNKMHNSVTVIKKQDKKFTYGPPNSIAGNIDQTNKTSFNDKKSQLSPHYKKD